MKLTPIIFLALRFLLLVAVFAVRFNNNNNGVEGSSSSGNNEIYVYHGDPYEAGPFLSGNFFIEERDGSPLHVSVWYPEGAGNFALNFFIGGLGGLVPTESYGQVLRGVVSHGVVVVGIDAIWTPTFDTLYGDYYDEQDQDTTTTTTQSKRLDLIDKYFQTLDFLHHNLNRFLHEKSPGTVASFDHVLLSGHSAGVDAGTLMLNRNCSWAHAAVMLEGGLGEPVNFTMPTLVYGTELAPQYSPIIGTCGRDINLFYDKFECPKVAVNVTTFGHCDILDPFFYESCRITKACKTRDGTNLPLYRMYAQGMITAWIVAVLQGNCDTLKYVTNPDFIPLPLWELKFDFGCLPPDNQCPKPGCINH